MGLLNCVFNFLRVWTAPGDFGFFNTDCFSAFIFFKLSFVGSLVATFNFDCDLVLERGLLTDN